MATRAMIITTMTIVILQSLKAAVVSMISKLTQRTLLLKIINLSRESKIHRKLSGGRRIRNRTATATMGVIKLAEIDKL